VPAWSSQRSSSLVIKYEIGDDARPDDPAVAAAAVGSGHRVMNRRTLISAVTAGLLAAPLAAEAQQGPRHSG
jgi:hypothetical protein